MKTQLIFAAIACATVGSVFSTTTESRPLSEKKASRVSSTRAFTPEEVQQHGNPVGAEVDYSENADANVSPSEYEKLVDEDLATLRAEVLKANPEAKPEEIENAAKVLYMFAAVSSVPKVTINIDVKVDENALKETKEKLEKMTPEEKEQLEKELVEFQKKLDEAVKAADEAEEKAIKEAEEKLEKMTPEEKEKLEKERVELENKLEELVKAVEEADEKELKEQSEVESAIETALSAMDANPDKAEEIFNALSADAQKELKERFEFMDAVMGSEDFTESESESESNAMLSKDVTEDVSEVEAKSMDDNDVPSLVTVEGN